MEKFKKYWWIILIVLALGYIALLNIKLNRLSDKNQLQAVELNTLKDEVAVYKNKNGELTYKIESVEIEKDNLRESLELLGIDIKTLRDDNIKWRKLNSVLQMQLSAVGHIEANVRPDTIRIESSDTIYYSPIDDWNNKSLYLFNTRVENKKLFSDYRYEVKFGIFQEPTKNGTLVTVKLTDPNATIISANSINVVSKTRWYKKWWFWGGIGLAGGIFIAK